MSAQVQDGHPPGRLVRIDGEVAGVRAVRSRARRSPRDVRPARGRRRTRCCWRPSGSSPHWRERARPAARPGRAQGRHPRRRAGGRGLRRPSVARARVRAAGDLAAPRGLRGPPRAPAHPAAAARHAADRALGRVARARARGAPRRPAPPRSRSRCARAGGSRTGCRNRTAPTRTDRRPSRTARAATSGRLPLSLDVETAARTARSRRSWTRTSRRSPASPRPSDAGRPRRTRSCAATSICSHHPMPAGRSSPRRSRG